MDDLELLAEYARSRSHVVFARIAERYIDLIYSAALRQTRDHHVAEDVSQAVLIILMNKAGSLPRGTIVPAWLLTVTRYAALDAIKMEARLKSRESQAATMNAEARSEPQPPRWDELSPTIDAAMLKLRMEDRDAIVLRYFLGKSPEEIAWVMGVNEEAARQRVSRALQRLRKQVARQGLTTADEALGTAISANAVLTAPTAVMAMAKAIAMPASGALATPPSIIARGTVRSLWWARHMRHVVTAMSLLFGGIAVMTLLLRNPKPPAPQPEVSKAVSPRVFASAVDMSQYQHLPRTITRLIWAGNRNDVAAIKQFLQAGDDPNVFSTDGNNTTAIMYALTHGGDAAFDATKMLIDVGADVNVHTAAGGYTPLMRAVLFRSPRTVQLLLQHGADPTAINNRSLNALGVARQNSDQQMVDLLQKAGAR
jgi:RNA polymerase sigma factor (sigma-70 family)